MNTSAYAYIIVAFCVAFSLQATPHNPCKDGPTPIELRVDGCDSMPCNLYRGTNLTAQWDFAAEHDSTELTTRVKVTFLGITINYDLPQPNACKSLTSGKCPLKKGDKATYSLNMPIEENYPSLTLTIEFALVNENKKAQVCFKVVGKVTSKYSLSLLH